MRARIQVEALVVADIVNAARVQGFRRALAAYPDRVLIRHGLVCLAPEMSAADLEVGIGVGAVPTR